MSNATAIDKSLSPPTALDYEQLRAEGMRYLEKTISAVWTDFNAHDPGITLLELLCFGITDIAYRTSFEDKDLFAPNPQGPSDEAPFFTAREVLTCGPVTANDYRRLILDRFVGKIRNAWVEPVSQTLYADTAKRILSQKQNADTIAFPIRGLHRIRLQFDNALAGDDKKSERDAVTAEVERLYHQHRNLGEDLASISSTDTTPIRVCADIKLAPDADIELVHATLVHALQAFLNPRIPRYRLNELVEKGLASEEIFNGPALQHGFILEDDLERSTSVSKVRASDLIAVMLRVPGVIAIPKLLLNYAGLSEDSNEWELAIPENREPVLQFEEARLRFYKDLIPFRPNKERSLNLLAKLDQADADAISSLQAEDFEIPAGQWRDLSEFTTLQESLPATYGVGSRGTGRDPAPQSIARARQLKAYLLVFDQILSNTLGQLTHLQELFSHNRTVRQSLFSNPVSDLPDLERLLQPTAGQSDLSAQEIKDAYTAIMQGSLQEEAFETSQRSKLLDHLLARFGEAFSDHVLMRYSAVGPQSLQEVLTGKAQFLSELPRIASRRGAGHDIRNADEVWDTANVSGFKQRLERILGFPSFKRRSLSDVTFDLYEEKDDDDKSEIRFRIVDRKAKSKKTILSGTTKYKDKTEATVAMKKAIHLGLNPANYEMRLTKDDRFYLVIVDRDVEPVDVVAMRKQYFKTEAEALEAQLSIADLLADRYSEEGSFVVEHILFRPQAPNWPLLPAPCEAIPTRPHSWDPYSHQVHIVLPGWGARLSEPDFRNFVEQTIRRELPAHLVARVCFVGRQEMGAFENAYRGWLTALAKNENLPARLGPLLKSIDALFTIYPEGTLHDCVEDGDETNPVILNRTHLGSIDTEQ
ncbi:hypothetical protein IEN85_14180 [Pelagicoccus sp. NFK12]|uniref:Uncharacterized protein n=1 Tax=Pelagicoccus enzymogenes TaxID=2773457 RepID=A0A927IHW7_9BACT|nr:hypothetical protein [Pelagicoccus enzymogenes]MBD5780646.1 hypothetical protein [Pelagicoccus enzymogenes]